MNVAGLSEQEIYKVVKKFVGAPDNDLRHFTHATLVEFLKFEAGVPPEIIPAATFPKADRLWGALKEAAPEVQRRVLVELLRRIPAPPMVLLADQEMVTREETRPQLEAMVSRLGSAGTTLPTVRTARDELHEALATARTLVQTHGPTAALDRIHTFVHGYLRELCAKFDVGFASTDSIMALYAKLRANVPNLAPPPEWVDEVDKVLKSQSLVLEQLNRARNAGTLSHSNPLLPAPEAALLIEATSALVNYLERKLG